MQQPPAHQQCQKHTSFGMVHSQMCHICNSYAVQALTSSRSHNQHCCIDVKQQKQNSRNLAACLEAVNNQLAGDFNGSILADNAIGSIQLIAGGEVSHCDILCCDTLWCKEAAAVATTQIAQSAGSTISTSCNQENLTSAGPAQAHASKAKMTGSTMAISDCTLHSCCLGHDTKSCGQSLLTKLACKRGIG